MCGEFSPAATFELRFLLDRVNRSSRRCHEGLTQLREGKIDIERYSHLLQQQIKDQSVLVERHRDFKIQTDSH